MGVNEVHGACASGCARDMRRVRVRLPDTVRPSRITTQHRGSIAQHGCPCRYMDQPGFVKGDTLKVTTLIIRLILLILIVPPP
jgi:hypothetical protein